MQLLGLYVVDLASVRAPDCCPLEIRAQTLYVLLVDPASVRATGCCLFPKAYTHDWVGIRLVVVVEKIKYKKRCIPNIAACHVGQQLAGMYDVSHKVIVGS